MSLLFEAAIESSLVLLAALALMPLLRKRPAALRHAVLAAALACAAAAPAIGRVVPSWHLPASLATLAGPAGASETAADLPGQGTGALPDGQRPSAAPTSPRFIVSIALRAAWIGGVVVVAAMLIVGLVRLARLAARARRVEQGPWVEQATAVARAYGLRRRVTLLSSDAASLVVMWGLWRPKVVLPASAARWPDSRVHVVLCHELAHARRGDWLVLLAAEALKCVYWFNPLVWIACARLREESERACDDVVVSGGVEATAYAGHLVAIARDLKAPRPWLPAPAVVRPSSLERRVQAMLDKRRNRGPVSRRAYAAAGAAMIAVTIGIASAQGGFASLTGSIVDPMNGVLPGVTLVLTNVATQAKYEVRTDRTGRYEFVALPAGEYLFEAKLPGFMAFKGKLAVAGQDVQRDLTLEVGSVQETITVANSRSNPVAPAPPSSPTAVPRRPAAGGCSAFVPASGPAIGGNLRPPMKLRDVRPIYAAQLAAQGIEGVVTLKGRIGTRGLIEDLEVVSTAHPDLAQAAADAVRQWEFTETLLNCEAVAIPIGITVNFTLKP